MDSFMVTILFCIIGLIIVIILTLYSFKVIGDIELKQMNAGFCRGCSQQLKHRKKVADKIEKNDKRPKKSSKTNI